MTVFLQQQVFTFFKMLKIQNKLSLKIFNKIRTARVRWDILIKKPTFLIHTQLITIKELKYQQTDKKFDFKTHTHPFSTNLLYENVKK